jgi:hypothetical protein
MRFALTAAVLFWGGGVPADAGPARHPIIREGTYAERGAFSQFPWEHIDTYSG